MESVFTLGMAKKRGERKKKVSEGKKKKKPGLTRHISIAGHVSVRSWLFHGYVLVVLSHRTADQCYQEFRLCPPLSAS